MSLKEAIKKLAKDNEEMYSVIATVEYVDQSKRICEVSPVNGDAKIFNVRLQALPSSDKAITFIPKKGSDVIVTFINKEEAFVSMTSEVESVIGEIGGQKLNYDKDGLQMKSTSADLKDSLNSVINVVSKTLSILNTFKLATPSGPTITVMPEIMAKLQKQKADLQKAKKELNTILK